MRTSPLQKPSPRAAFPGEVARPVKRVSGRTPIDRTPLAVRTTGVDVGPSVRDHVRKRLGSRLGKFALQIQRVSVRLIDVNGPKGGVDTACRIKVVLNGLESVVVEEVAAEVHEAIDRAGHVAERAVRSALGRARTAAPRAARGRRAAPPTPRRERARTNRDKALEAGSRRRKRRPLSPPEDGSLIGRRVGQSDENLARAAERPEKERRDATVDTARPGWNATDRRAGGSSTAARNTKLRAPRAAAALEDSAEDRPSRKSTRKSENRQKQDGNLRQRQTRASTAPKTRAARAAARA
jgi:ribosome-associated translation inhibitor RaiA